MISRTKIYFASDFHLGAGDYATFREREMRIVRWLDSIKNDAAELFLMGDVFDFWFEYKTVVPKGYIRFFGKLAELRAVGVNLYFFKGNHDMWMFDYFQKELGAVIISDELILERDGKKFYLHHGDGLGPGDKLYKILKKIFRSNLSQWVFARFHPNFGVGIANYWSSHSRLSNQKKKKPDPTEQEWLVTYCHELLKLDHFDFLIFGHRHKPLDIKLNSHSRYINLGEWLHYNSYCVFDGVNLSIQCFE